MTKPESPASALSESNWFAWLCRKYVQRADVRQRDMGLQYTEAETHDLAAEIAKRVVALTAQPTTKELIHPVTGDTVVVSTHTGRIIETRAPSQPSPMNDALGDALDAAAEAVSALPVGDRAWGKKEYMIAETAAQHALDTAQSTLTKSQEIEYEQARQHKYHIDRFEFELGNVKAELAASQTEVARLRELFRIDGEQHAKHVRGLTEQYEMRLQKYIGTLRKRDAERERHQTLIDMARSVIARALYELKRRNLPQATWMPPWEKIGEAQAGYFNEADAALAAIERQGFVILAAPEPQEDSKC